MSKRIFVLVLTIVIIMGVIAGCSSSAKNDTASEAVSNAAVAPAAADAEVKFNENMDSDGAADQKVLAGSSAEEPQAEEKGATGIANTGTEGSSLANAILSQRKIIRNANVTVQVDNFDITYGKIQTMVEHSGYGYIQQSRVSKQNALTKSGMVVIRVQADKFSDILNSVKGLGEVIDASENTDDVTEKFYDVESELRLLKYEQTRLEEYLHKLTKPDDIFQTEDKLTQIRHQIESLTGTLNKLSDLVKLSTITINIYEKTPDSDKDNKEESYWTKLSGKFSDSLKGVGNFFANLVLFLVQALPVLVLLALFGWIALLIYRKLPKDRKNRQRIESKTDSSDHDKTER